MIRCILVCVLSVSLSAIAVAPSTGMTTSARAPGSIDDGPSSVAGPHAPASATASCTLDNGPISTISLVLQTPDYWTAVATRLRIGSCTACAPNVALTPTDVSLRVRWIVPGSAQVEVSVIGGIGSGTCFVPDESNVICAPVTYPIASSVAGGVIYTLPMPGDCCLFEDAFVLMRFSWLTDPSPSLSHGLTMSTVSCATCDQYLESAVDYPSLTDFCAGSGDNPIWVSVHAVCCEPTPATPDSWGRLKMRYR